MVGSEYPLFFLPWWGGTCRGEGTPEGREASSIIWVFCVGGGGVFAFETRGPWTLLMSAEEI